MNSLRHLKQAASAYNRERKWAEHSQESEQDQDVCVKARLVGKEVVASSAATLSLTVDDRAMLDALMLKYATPTGWEPWVCLGWTGMLFMSGCMVMYSWPCWLSCFYFAACHVRVFIVFHDMCHLSFFRDRKLNLWWAEVMGTIACYAVKDFRESHNIHHAHLGDKTVTDFSLTIHHDVEQFNSRPLWQRIGLRIVREPLVFYVIGALYLFHLYWLWSVVRDLDGPRLMRAVWYAVLYLCCGWEFLTWTFVAQMLGGAFGIALFHLQHQCNTPYRVEHDERTLADAGLLGSTYVHVPWPLTVFTLGVEVHQVHHVSTRVPSYRLTQCHAEGEAAGLWDRAGVNKVGPLRAFKSLFHVLYEVAPEKLPSGVAPKFVSFEPWQSLGLHD